MIITEDMLTYKRPGNGIPADMYNSVIGTTSLMNIKKNTIIKPSMLDSENV